MQILGVSSYHRSFTFGHCSNLCSASEAKYLLSDCNDTLAQIRLVLKPDGKAARQLHPKDAAENDVSENLPEIPEVLFFSVVLLPYKTTV